MAFTKLNNAKSDYKKLQKKLKNQYKRQQGDMVQQLKKNNPKQFFKNFNRHNSRPPNVSLQDFFKHFRNLASDSSSTYISIANYLDTDSPIFDSLDTKITSLEIDACIRKL